MPRTTIDLEPTILDALKERQRAEGRTLGQVASELLARALADDVHPVEEFRWTAKAMGARIDLDDADAVRRAARRSMSRAVDANLLLYASDAASSRYEKAPDGR